MRKSMARGAFALLLGLALPAAAEEEKAAVGFKLGPNSVLPEYESVTKAGLEDNDMTRAWFGIFAEAPLKGPFFLQPELFYAPYAIEVHDPNAMGGAPAIPAEYHLAYLELPMLLKAKFRRAASFRPLLFVGVTPGYLLSSEARTKISFLGLTGGATIDLEDSTEKFRFTTDLGAGFEWALGPAAALVFDARYSRGWTDVYKGAPDRFDAFRGAFGLRFALREE